MHFLENSGFRSKKLDLNIKGLSPIGLFLGKGRLALEVAALNSDSKPTAGKLEKAYKKRKKQRARPVLVVVTHPSGSSLCGTSGARPAIFHCKDKTQAERLCASALELPSRHAAISFLSNAMPSLETKLPGIANEGLLSLHELTKGTKDRSDWADSVKHAKKVLGKSQGELIKELGYTRKSLDTKTYLLSAGEERTALAILLNDDEMPEQGTERFNNMSPISYALTKAEKEQLPWVMVVQSYRVRLYNTSNIGVGRRGRTETFIECQTSIISENDIGLLWLLFSANALKKDGSIYEILEESRRFAKDVAEELRNRIYDNVVPALAIGIANIQQIKKNHKKRLELTYEMALIVLFRLLFIAYAEDRNLLPYKSNEAYRKRSLKQKAFELAKSARTPIPTTGEGYHHWNETAELWKAVARGNKEWGVPAYNGTLFSNDAGLSVAGAKLEEITLPNEVFKPILSELLLSEDSDPVDFRALSVREFGTIYEGLLESELSLAEQHLSCEKDGSFKPSGKTGQTIIQKGTIYLHNKSGVRKSTGSFFTPDFAVDHLLDGALEKALDEHLKRISNLSESDRAKQLFDFRVADIAMGSGHFLVAAIDRIERSFASFLDDHPTKDIMEELQDLRLAAMKELGELSDSAVIEDGQLLRRLIARRCIYGVDINPIAVQLARLSIWIHTFVPGLPLSLLDHHLVHGNSLIGVGSLDEIKEKFDQGKDMLFEVDAKSLLGKAGEPLMEIAQLSDKSIKDIEAARRLMEQARLKTFETEALCDLITAQQVSDDSRLLGYMYEDWDSQKNKLQNSAAHKFATKLLKPLNAIHFPIIFPEAFLGHYQGFNVILGNPPWDKVKVEEDSFLARHFPGMKSLPQRDFEKEKRKLYKERPDLEKQLNEEKTLALSYRMILHSSSAIMGAGDPDLYKAFAWRFISISGIDGHLGIVMPRSVLSSKGCEQLRKYVFVKPNLVEITVLTNRARWVFDIHPQYSIALVCFKKTRPLEMGIRLKGPYDSLEKLKKSANQKAPLLSFEVISSWNESYSIPMFPRQDSYEVFATLKQSPSLSSSARNSWAFLPDRELDATQQKDLMDFRSDSCPQGYWPVYKGASFNLWEPDTGVNYAYADPKTVLDFIQTKRKNSWRIGKGAHRGFSEKRISDTSTMATLKPRIAFQAITRSTDSRTVICSIIPPNVFLTHGAPYLLRVNGDEKDEAFLLGVLSSIPLDWYARRYVETNLTHFIINSFPIPRPERHCPLWTRVVKLSGRLACSDDRFSDWAKAVGVKCGRLTTEDKCDKICELDAAVAHLYGVSELQLIHIFETFHVGWDYRSRLDRVINHYRTLEERT